MKKQILIISILGILTFNSYGQNSPLTIYGNGLDGSTYQLSAIYSDVNGLLLEAPLNSSGVRLPINFNWRGGGIPALFISSDSKIGIGTNAPNWKLHVKGAITAEGDGGSNYSDFNLKNGNMRWHISGPRYGENNRLGIFWNDGTTYYDYFTIATNGSIGIGIASPSSQLDIAGHLGGTNNRNFRVKYYLNEDPFIGGAELSGISHVRGYWTALYANQGNASSAAIFDGKVGIKVAAPTNVLELQATSSTPVSSDGNAINIHTSDTYPQCLLFGVNQDNNYSYIQSGKGGVGPQNLVFNQFGGNVSIGTTSFDPRFKLNVEGTIRASEVKVCLQGGCDFVFKTDYKLRDLNELEKFVKANQHLPEIASEKDMVENGVNMKELQMKLLQKIEELTLYTIEQNKKLEVLEKIVKVQNEKIEKLEAASK